MPWQLAEWTVRSLALAAVAGGSLWLLGARDVSVRLSVWTVVLIGALLMPVFSWVAPAVELPVPRWESPAPPAPTPSLWRLRTGASEPSALASGRTITPVAEINWAALATGLWAAIAAAMLAQLALGIWYGRRLIRSATPLDLDAAARVYSSESVRVPITLGLFRPAIVLPPNWRGWEERKLAAVLAHESAHVRRRDPLRQLLASVYRALFWFSPLAWWLHRELADLAEAASDDAALAAMRDETLYAEILLNFFATTPRRVQWNAVAMAIQGKATKRMERILNTGRKLSRGLTLGAVAALAIAAVPVLYLAATVSPVWAVVNDQAPPPTPPPALPAPPAPAAADIGPAIAPEPPEPPEPPAVDGDGGERFAIVTGDDTHTMASPGPGDRERLRALRKQTGADFLWFTRDGGEYIVKDPEILARVRQAFDAIEQQGRRMGEKGRAEGEAARKMAEEFRAMAKPNEAEMRTLAEQMAREAARLQEQIGNDENVKHAEAQIHEIEKQMRAKEKEFSAIEKQFSAKEGDFAKVEKELEKAMKSMEIDIERSVKQAQEQLKFLEDESLRSKKAEKII